MPNKIAAPESVISFLNLYYYEEKEHVKTYFAFEIMKINEAPNINNHNNDLFILSIRYKKEESDDWSTGSVSICRAELLNIIFFVYKKINEKQIV